MPWRWPGGSVHLLGRARLESVLAKTGEIDNFAGHLEEALAVARAQGHHQVAARAQVLLGVCWVADRDWVAARSVMTIAMHALREVGDWSAAVDVMYYLGAILTELAQPRAAATQLREAIVEARRIGCGYGEIQCAWAVAFLAARSGRPEDATKMDDTLAERLTVVERVIPAVLVVDYSAAMGQARQALELGVCESRGLGLGWLRSRPLEVATDIAGSPAGPIPAGSPDLLAAVTSPHLPKQRQAVPHPVLHSGLTSRELEVLSAIASGRTNAQIASSLFLSAKTVMHHSTSIYRKLGVRGRAGAVDLAYRSGMLQAPGR